MVARAQLLSDHARKMRCSPTPSEERLWQRLKGSQLGVGFRRQHVLGSYIVDFAAPKARLVVEVDGAYHAERVGADAKRDARLAWAGWRIVRVASDEPVEVAVARIVAELEGWARPGCHGRLRPFRCRVRRAVRITRSAGGRRARCAKACGGA